MSTISQKNVGAPASNLCFDVLATIFDYNADMYLESEEEFPALSTLRHTSQVCASWRTLILGSPALWARVLNTIHLEGRKDWQDEVMKRTKDSRLSIKAAHPSPPHSNPFEPQDAFIRIFVTKYWPRISHLDIDTTTCRPFGDEATAWCQLFSCPSGLHRLKFKSYTHAADLFPPLTPTLFPTLEYLDLSDHSEGYVGDVRDDRIRPPVFLPKLKRIKVQSHWPDSIRDVLTILERITPAMGCLLCFWAPITDFPHELDTIAESLPRVLSKYLHYAGGNFVSLSGALAHITITPSLVDFKISSHGKEIFRCGLEYEQVLPVQAISQFIACFDSFQCNEIKRLSFTVHFPPQQRDLAVAAIRQFSRAFPHIEEMVVDGDTISHVTSFQHGLGYLLFPNLKSVVLGKCNALDLKTFLDSRNSRAGKVGKLVLKLDPEIIAIFEVLRGFSDLNLNLSDSEERTELAVQFR